ncbi:putative nucleotidyltransferase [Nocardioides aromaticivorans]|uniref:Putative nucleotidyltransferase n=1 Tax=Nocardioides aromaticivorans TaxID=200618 RepID=A0A7Y9ZMZ1_9ACTN|nr:hypothetical protein [Nocardioides aromaticivorans]NYI46915.1 putative nucleotidyltransferase [Nocardioides aromaticivorans]
MVHDDASSGAARPAGVAGQDALRAALKLVAVALKEGGLPFALAGSYGIWARGGPEPDHDVDFMVAEEDALRARDLLAERDLVVVQPPEDWLFKVFVDDAMVDVIHRVGGEPLDRSRFDEAEVMEVESVQMPVLPATVLMADKLGAMEEHACNLTPVIPAARAIREQVDWAEVQRRTEGNPFAEACLVLLRRLDVAAPHRPNASHPAGAAQG